MISRWDERAAAQAVERWGPQLGTDLALRLYTADLIGREPELVLHGGGNVSLKQPRTSLFGTPVPALYVKASGRDLAGLGPQDLPALELEPLRRLRTLESLDDEAMLNELRRSCLDADAPTPSIETLVHAFLPPRFVDHSHADAVLTLTNQPDGSELVRAALGTRVGVLPYIRPGFELAKAAAELYEAQPQIEGLVLLHHGLLTFGDEARTSYERHIAIVTACEKFIRRRAGALRVKPSYRAPAEPAELAALAAPLLRGLLATPTGDEDRPWQRWILDWDSSATVLEFVNSDAARELAATGPLTTDHLIHTRAFPLFIPEPFWSDADALRRQLAAAVEDYRERYRAYVSSGRGAGSAGEYPVELADCTPRVVLLPGAGALCWGRSKREARTAADITRHTLATKLRARALGRYVALPAEHLYAMEFRALQRAKLTPPAVRPLDGQVVIISGGAGALGAAIGETCARAGAHVVLCDINEARLRTVVAQLEATCGPETATGVVMDVTDEDSVRQGYAEACRTCGGVDVVVPNAGVAHVAPLEELEVADFRRVIEINATGYLIFMREGVRVLRRQGLGGHIVINASKNVFGPGRDFGAYSASKAAGHQLGKVAALELAQYGIRVNMINADAVFAHGQIPSGLWAEVGPQRARSRGLKPEELPEYYRKRNLLNVRVCGHHVGNAVVFFASNATPTTGATLPVDGGVPEAFPR